MNQCDVHLRQGHRITSRNGSGLRRLEHIGVIAAYREHYGVCGHRPLGDYPADTSRRQRAWLAARTALRELPTHTAGTPSPLRPPASPVRTARGRSIDL